MRAYSNHAELDEVVRRFENCEFAIHEFDHAAHLTVAVVYVARYGESAAMERMRDALIRFSRHHGKMGYHETITRFWLRIIASEPQDSGPLHARANKIVRKYSDKELIFRYYTREQLMSDFARANWLEPELSPGSPASL